MKNEQSRIFHYTILINDTQIYHVENTTPKVWRGIQAETGRTYIPNKNWEGQNWRAATGSFRNLKLISEYHQ